MQRLFLANALVKSKRASVFLPRRTQAMPFGATGPALSASFTAKRHTKHYMSTAYKIVTCVNSCLQCCRTPPLPAGVKTGRRATLLIWSGLTGLSFRLLSFRALAQTGLWGMLSVTCRACRSLAHSLAPSLRPSLNQSLSHSVTRSLGHLVSQLRKK